MVSAEFNGRGDLNIDNLSFGAAVAVPEPTTVALLLAAGLLWPVVEAGRRRPH